MKRFTEGRSKMNAAIGRHKGRSNRLKVQMKKRKSYKNKFPASTGSVPKIHVGDHVVKKLAFVENWKKSKTAKMMRKLGNTSVYTNIATFGNSSAESLQGVANGPLALLDSNQILSIFANNAQFYNSTASAAITEQTAAGFRSIKTLIDNIVHELRLSNMAPSTAELDVYLLSAKNTELGLRDPTNDWTNALANENATAAARAVTDPYTKPTLVKGWNLSWNVLKCWNVSMEAGREICFIHNFNPHCVLDMEYCQKYGQIKGLTHAWLIVQRGTLADTSKTATIGNIGLTKSKIIGAQRVTVKSSLVSPFNRNYNYSTNLHQGDTSLYEQDARTATVLDADLDTNFA